MLQVKYDNINPESTLGRSMVVATDKYFKNCLRLTRRHTKGIDTFTFQYQYKKLPKKLYVKPPSLLVPVVPDPSEPVTIDLNFDSKTAIYQGQEIFSVQSAETTKIASGVFHIDITTIPSKIAVPTQTRLKIGDMTLEETKTSGPSTTFSFNDETGFEAAAFLFVYNTGAKDQIDDLMEKAVLIIDEFVIDTDSIPCSVTSDWETLEIIVE